MLPLAALPPNADPYQMILNAARQYPWVGGIVGLLLLANVVMWLLKPEKKGRRR
jgi:hypothetical protein